MTAAACVLWLAAAAAWLRAVTSVRRRARSRWLVGTVTVDAIRTGTITMDSLYAGEVTARSVREGTVTLGSIRKGSW